MRVRQCPRRSGQTSLQIVGGRDLEAGGSWLAMHRDGRYAAVTNVRSGKQEVARRSRGELVGGFLARASITVDDYLAAVADQRSDYGPFNLVVGDTGGAGFVSSIDGMPRRLVLGVHAFSNGRQDDEWPKMRRLRENFDALRQSGKVDDTAWLDLLLDTTRPDERDLPETGVGIAIERTLAPIFVAPVAFGGRIYGTRASTLAYARTDGSRVLRERRFGPDGLVSGESAIVF